jgi:hypothetical protein
MLWCFRPPPPTRQNSNDGRRGMTAATTTSNMAARRGVPNKSKGTRSKNNHRSSNRVGGRIHGPSSSVKAEVVDGPATFAFHKRYVRDVSGAVRMLEDAKKDASGGNPHQRRESVRRAGRELERQALGGGEKKKGGGGDDDDKQQQKRKRVLLHRVPGGDVTYAVPGEKPPGAPGNNRGRTLKDAVIDLLTSLTLASVNDMIYIQGIENKKLTKFTPPVDRLG